MGAGGLGGGGSSVFHCAYCSPQLYGRDTGLMLGDWLIALSFELAGEAAQRSATSLLVKILADQMKLTTVGEARGLDIQRTIDWRGYVDLAASSACGNKCSYVGPVFSAMSRWLLICSRSCFQLYLQYL